MEHFNGFRLESIMLQNLLIMLLAFPQFLPIMLIFMLSKCEFIFIIVHYYIKMIIIGIKYELQEQMQYKSFMKMYKN